MRSRRWAIPCDFARRFVVAQRNEHKIQPLSIEDRSDPGPGAIWPIVLIASSGLTACAVRAGTGLNQMCRSIRVLTPSPSL
jgi:hypothetical protein